MGDVSKYQQDFLISVITITCGDPEGLSRTLASLCRQSITSFEWIVVCDESTVIPTDLPFPARKVLSTAGIANALNEGTLRASGDWLIYLNGGDSFAESRIIEKLVPFARAGQRETQIFYGDFFSFEGGAKVFHRSDHDMLWRTNSINHQSVLISSVIARRNPYDSRLLLGMDYDLWLRLVDKIEFRHLGFPVCNFDSSGRSGARDWFLHQAVMRFMLRTINSRRRVGWSEILMLSRAVLVAGLRKEISSRIPFRIRATLKRLFK